MADETITVSEYIAEQERLEKEAKELFPKKFDVCSHSMGYIRQPVYSCLTCNPTEEAGFCYSCSISCHGDHNLVELFTKRHFRCDCGTDKFKTTPCKLDPKKTTTSRESLNQYNHNYLGRFCWCDIQYDPTKEENTMLQCVVCEDWFHDTCIGITPHSEDFADFICRDCTKAHPFLRQYAQNPLFMIAINKADSGPKAVTMIDCSKDLKEGSGANADKDTVNSTNDTESTDVDVTTITSGTSTSVTSKVLVDGIATATAESLTTTSTTTATNTATTTLEASTPAAAESLIVQATTTQVKRSVEVTDDDKQSEHSNKRVKLDTEKIPTGTCKFKEQAEDAYPGLDMCLFVSEGWRDLLCQCNECMTMYTVQSCSFIVAEEEVYEDEDDDEQETSVLESGMKKLNEMDRVQMMEGMLAYSKMRDEIKDFLAPFSAEGKTVTADDIQAFFAAKMEQRAAAAGKPNFF
ncbi:hypothetical protein BG004_005279 [Podila humilis]|nr:hypothetical protein BG004_005279 [Podila humilis]